MAVAVLLVLTLLPCFDSLCAIAMQLLLHGSSVM